jgi:hypothetical protein
MQQHKELMMIRLSSLCFVLSWVSIACALEMPEMPKPQKEHEFLQKFVGEWDSVGKGTAPDGQTLECTGTAKSRMLGGFWIISEGKGKAMEMPMENIMTVGFDTEKGTYVGTWVNHMWKYEGTVEGDKLILNAEGPDMTNPGEKAMYRDEFEFKSPDHYVLTSSAQGKDGKWVTFMRADVTRKK